MLIDDHPASKDRYTLFICTEQDWRHGQQSLCQVTFHSPDLLETTADGAENERTHGLAEQNQQNRERRPLTISVM
jgi:hypothetical protein